MHDVAHEPANSDRTTNNVIQHLQLVNSLNTLRLLKCAPCRARTCVSSQASGVWYCSVVSLLLKSGVQDMVQALLNVQRVVFVAEQTAGDKLKSALPRRIAAFSQLSCPTSSAGLLGLCAFKNTRRQCGLYGHFSSKPTCSNCCCSLVSK